MAKVSKKFVDETLWPEFEEISDTLESYLSDVTARVISQVIHQDSSEAEVVNDPPQLPQSTTPPLTDTVLGNMSQSTIFNPPTGSPSQSSVRKEGVNALSSKAGTDKSSKNRKKRDRKKKRKR
jgi:hypothetical protein